MFRAQRKMSGSFFIVSTLAAVFAVIAYLFVARQQVDRGLCSIDKKPPRNVELRNSLGLDVNYNDSLECYFSENYYEARQQFLLLAQALPAQMISMNVVNDLTTDVAILRGNPEKFLIHISGTHGVEAYAGSATQAAILEYLAKSGLYENEAIRSELPTIVFVHALNPFGFANNRRVNEDNVDLNRNVLNEDEFRFVSSRDPNYAGYVDLDSNLNPTAKFHENDFINEILSYAVLGKSVIVHGLAKLKKALVSGNYHKETGVGFGGFKQTRSIENILNLLLNDLSVPTTASEFILLDVHTGLGPEGVDTLIYQGSPDWVAKIDKVFATDYLDGKVFGGIKVEEFTSSPLPKKRSEKTGNSKDINSHAKQVASGYELTVGTITGSMCSNYLASEKTKYICITQVRTEFVASL